MLVEFVQSSRLWPTLPLHLHAPQAVGRANDSFRQACQSKLSLYNSCTDRHCPQCTGARRSDWLDKAAELRLPGVTYFQVVFTLPDKLSAIMLSNRAILYCHIHGSQHRQTQFHPPSACSTHGCRVHAAMVAAYSAQELYQDTLFRRLQQCQSHRVYRLVPATPSTARGRPRPVASTRPIYRGPSQPTQFHPFSADSPRQSACQATLSHAKLRTQRKPVI